MILTIDLGTSVTKVALWDEEGLLAVGRAELDRSHQTGNRVEQDPASWWASLVAACAAARASAPGAFSAVHGIGCSAARQTFVPVTAGGEPIGTALVWSDRRASEEAALLTDALGGRRSAWMRTGVVLDGGSVAAKVAWLASHDAERLRDARWLLAPRDLVVWRLTGELCTDVTLASATGMYEWSGTNLTLVTEVAGAAAERIPEVRPSTTIAGGLRDSAARALGLPADVPVVIGAGDRPCEVLGTGATTARPMVSWGTTANVSVPVDERPDQPPVGLIVTAGALGGWLLEGGLSAAGSAVEWLAGLAGIDSGVLLSSARSSPPGARGVLAFPWLGGARAPWWRADAGAGVVGLAFDHRPADVARALVEGVAYDVVRCLEAAVGAGSPGVGAGPAGFVGAGEGGRAAPVEIALGGGGSILPVWTDVLTAVTGLPAVRRRSGEAASAGAALLTAEALGIDVDVDRLDPVEGRVCPDAAEVATYRSLRTRADETAAALLALGNAR